MKWGRTESDRQETAKVTDPVCGMEFQVDKAVARSTYEGRTYYFCTEACRKQFEEQPPKYLG